MNKKINKNLIFIAENPNTHTVRWEAYFKSKFTNYIFLNMKVNSAKEINSIILKNFNTRQTIIFSGPIHNVSSKLRIGEYSHFLLSYGYDLQLYLDSIKHLLSTVNSQKNGGFIVDNNFNLKILTKIGIPKKKIFNIPWGLESHWFDNDSANRRFYLDQPQTFLSARNHENIYNVSFSIKLFNQYLRQGGQGVLLILGSGSLTKQLNELVISLDINNHVEFVGQVSEREYKNFLSTANFYLSSSQVDGTSISLLQSMSTGVIPIVSDIRTNREWVKHNYSGFLFNFKNGLDFFSLNQKYFSDNNLDEISLNAKNLVELKCNWSENLKALTEFIVQNS